MMSFYADEFSQALVNLFEFERKLELLKPGYDPLPPTEASDGSRVIGDFLRECNKAGLRRPLERADRLQYLGEPGRDQSRYPGHMVQFELQELRKAVMTDLREATFLRLDDSAEANYERPELFGNAVSKKFPKASYDITEAGSCHAIGRYTACVFHLMRVVEHGLRGLARALRVPFSKTVELKEWAEIIDAIEKEIQHIIKKPKSAKRTKDLQFYNTAAAQLHYFKDGWTNHVMHTRSNYDENQASIVMVHVREFMQHLATRIKQ